MSALGLIAVAALAILGIACAVLALVLDDGPRYRRENR